jgi:hypothetical protein
MTPDLPLAKSITAAVMDQAERDGCLNSDRIAEAVLARMLVRAGTPPLVSDDVARLAFDLLVQIGMHEKPAGGWSASLHKTFNDLAAALKEARRI